LYHLGLLLLLTLSVSLRFINLPYSEFQDDEKKTQIKIIGKETVVDFLLRQRKGPMQFLVAYIPFSLNKGEVNELAVRLPFAIANLLSVFVLYALIFKVTKSHLASLLSSLIYSMNGFIVGFSRIAQYQNLNLLFSFLALYFYAELKYKKEKFLVPSVVASIFLSLSVLSHWDAIYYLVPICCLFLTFLFRRDVAKREKITCVLAGILVGALLVLPFLIPYINGLISNQSGNMEYLLRRIGTDGSQLIRHKFIFELYNPLITLWLYVIGLVMAILFIRKTSIFFLWFVVNFILIKYFMVTPKTHIYNYVVPMIVTSSLGIYYLYELISPKKRWVAPLFYLIISTVVGLLYVQSYQIFVDHGREYPFDEKNILWHHNPVFKDIEIITFGFPHNRNWKVVNQYIDSSCRYITNENKGIAQIYVKAINGYLSEGCLYLVVIKRPFYTQANEAVYAEAKKSKIVYKYVKDGDILTKVYRLR
jgi:hypothetical protein